VTRFVSASPVLTVERLADATAFYCGVLGFQLDFDAGDVAGLVRDGVLVLLIDAESPNARQAAGSGNVSFLTTEVDALHRRCRTAGADIIVEPGDRPYGQRDFALRDPDGNVLVFGCALDD